MKKIKIKHNIIFLIFLLFAVLILGLLSTFHLNSEITRKPVKTEYYSLSGTVSQNTRHVIFPRYGTSFDVPGWTVTNNELGPNNPNPMSAIGSGQLLLYSPDTNVNKKTWHQTAGVEVLYELGYSYNFDKSNIPFDGTGGAKLLDSSKLLSPDSILSPQNVTMYTYLGGDGINGHGRGKIGSVHQGAIRLDLAFPDHSKSTIGINFICYDHSSKSAISKRCGEVLTTLLATIRLRNGMLLMPIPIYSEYDIFGSLDFVKRQFNLSGNSTGSAEIGKPVLDQPLATIRKQPELLKPSDEELSVMRCMPEQIYINGQGILYTVPNDADNYNDPIHIVDPNVLKIISILEANILKGYELTQFTACQTDDNRYIVEYNVAEQDLVNTGFHQNYNFTVSFALMWPNGYMQDVVDVPLPSRQTTCHTPLELTKSNLYYFECDTFTPTSPKNQVAKRSNLYRIDFARRKYSLTATCDNTWTSIVTCY